MKESHSSLENKEKSKYDFEPLTHNVNQLQKEVVETIRKRNRFFYAARRLDYHNLEQSRSAFRPYCVMKRPVKTYYRHNIEEKHKNIGSEESVLIHHYNDDTPNFLNPYNISQSLYEPRNIDNIWVPYEIDYDSAMQLKENINRLVKLSIKERRNYMEHLTEIHYVTEQDCLEHVCDKELIGHRGLFANQDIPAFTVIGVYAGVFLRSPEELEFLQNYFPMNHIEDYLFRVAEEEEWPKISAFGVGNRLTIANSVSNFKSGLSKAQDEIKTRRTLITTYGKSRECPFREISSKSECPDVLFLVTCRDVSKGEQLLYDYGPVYWAN